MKLSGRGASQTPTQAAEEVLNVQPEDEESEAWFSNQTSTLLSASSPKFGPRKN
jgi:hypothetical protein